MKGARPGVLAIAATALIVFILRPYWSAAALIMRATGTPGWAAIVAQWDTESVRDSVVLIPDRDRPDDWMRVRIFRPDGAPRRAALLVSGVHPDGIKEPRLVALARELSAAGVVVATPEIDDLINYRVTGRATNTIEEAALWMINRPDMFGREPIGLIGVSFSGGLSIVAAGRPSLRGRLAYVLSFGGHGNLPRVLHYLCTGVEPAFGEGPPRKRPPHDYALAVLAHQAADLAVPPAQAAPLRQAIETFLQASAQNRTSPQAAAHLFEEAVLRQRALSEPAATFMQLVNERNVAALGQLLLPFLDRLGQDPSLSPDRSAPPSAPVYLLHGADDNVIPGVESSLLAQHLRPHTRVRQLLSQYLTHVDLASRPTMRDTWDMVAFWKAVLGEH